MTVCSSPHLEALRLLSRKEGNSSSAETESESEGRGGFKLGTCSWLLLTSLPHCNLSLLSWVRVSRSRLLLSSSGGQRYLAQCGELLPSLLTIEHHYLSQIGGLAIVTFFLRMQIINIIGRKRRKREESEASWTEVLESVGREQLDKILHYTEPQPQSNTEPNSCLLELWRCMSGGLEDLLQYLDHTHLSLMTVAQSLLARVVFRGANTSMWLSVMRIPQVGPHTTDHSWGPQTVTVLSFPRPELW